MNTFKKILMVALFLGAVTVANADEGGGGNFKLGFYGGINGNLTGGYRTTNDIGLLFNLGNGLEINLGIGFRNISTTTEGKGNNTVKDEEGTLAWAITPGASYRFGVIRETIGYGAGLDMRLASGSETASDGSGGTVTNKPGSMDMGFLPYFYMSAEVAKNFEIGIKTGFAIDFPPGTDAPTYTISHFGIGTYTGILFKFYL